MPLGHHRVGTRGQVQFQGFLLRSVQRQLLGWSAQRREPLTKTETARRESRTQMSGKSRREETGRPHLPQRAGSDAQIVNHEDGNQERGGEREPPAQRVAPPRVRGDVVELQRSVLDQGEDKCCLQAVRKTNLRKASGGNKIIQTTKSKLAGVNEHSQSRRHVCSQLCTLSTNAGS